MLSSQPFDHLLEDGHPAAPTSPSGSTTFVIPVREDPGTLEAFLDAGAGDRLLVLAEAVPNEVAARLEGLSQTHGFAMHPVSGAQGQVGRWETGLRHASSDGLVMLGDGDRIEGLASFLREADAYHHEAPEALLITIPFVYLCQGEERRLQYDRRGWHGKTGRELLAKMVETGELGLLAAGTRFSVSDLGEALPDPVFDRAGELVLMARLCAKYPDRKIYVTGTGSYLRRPPRPGEASFAAEDLALHLVSLSVGACYLMEEGAMELDAFLEMLRHRGAVLQQVYGVGEEGVRVFTALLEGRPLDAATPEADAVLRCLDTHWDALPEECRLLFGRAAQETASEETASSAPSTAADEAQVASLAHIVACIEANRPDEAREAIDAHRGRYEGDPALPSLEATLALVQGDRWTARRVLARALVREPTAFDYLHMLGNICFESQDHEGAVRLYTRALRVAGEAELLRMAPSWQKCMDMGIGKPILSPRLAFIVSAHVDQFLEDLPCELVSEYEVCKFVVRSERDIVAAMEWADVCWFEWCDRAVVFGSNHPLAREKKMICRLHRYEVFTDVPAKVNWERVDHVILVTDHLRHLLRNRVPDLEDRTTVSVVQNGVNLRNFPFQVRTPGHHIAFIGYIHLRKNPMMLLQILARLVARDPRYRLFLAGRFQDDLSRLYWEYMVAEMGLEAHVQFDGWQQDIAAWLEDKNYLLSTSIHESFGYAIAEGMARGIKPVVHNFPFAHEIWAEEMLFNTVDEAVEMITDETYESHTYRAFIARHYSLEKQVDGVRRVLKRLMEPVRQPDRSPRPSPNIAGAGLRACVD